MRLMAAALLTLAGCSDAPAAVPASPLKRGLNIANWTRWRESEPERFTRAQFEQVRRAGFDFVRIVTNGMDATDAVTGKVDAAWLQTLDDAVDNATAARLSVIVDEHDHLWCRQNGPACRTKLSQFWGTVAARYRNRPRSVLFEILNEPNGEINAIWNDTVAEVSLTIASELTARTRKRYEPDARLA